MKKYTSYRTLRSNSKIPGPRNGTVPSYGLGSSIAGGAASGALAGASFGIPGAIVGAVAGGVQGYFKNQAQQQVESAEEEARMKREQMIKSQKELAAINTEKATLSSYNTTGVPNAGFMYQDGGNIPSSAMQYKVEDQEVIQHAPDDIPMTDENGQTKRLSSDASKYEGDSHDAPSGGIGGANRENARVFSNRLTVSADFAERLKHL